MGRGYRWKRMKDGAGKHAGSTILYAGVVVVFAAVGVHRRIGSGLCCGSGCSERGEGVDGVFALLGLGSEFACVTVRV
jgi:hypothetical protein